MSDSLEFPQSTPPRPPVRRRASAFRRSRSLRRYLLQAGAAVALVAVAATAVLGTTLALSASSLPRADSLIAAPLPSDTLIYDRSGQTLLADLHPPGYQHYEVSLSQMGEWLPEATVAVEDANFWNEPGVDPLSIGRAAITDLQAHAIVQGGSTITQQLVKRQLVGSDTSVSRKLREAALAVRISHDFSKSQILDMYLNDVAYGNTAYGAQAAARIYFHVDASQLDLAQASLLAGLPQNPTQLNPLANYQAAKDRQVEVLDAMVRNHYITRSQADQALSERLSLYEPVTINLAPSFVSWVSAEIAARFGQDAVTGGGLHVVSSLDWNLQQMAQTAVTDTVKAEGYRNVTDGALVAIDPRTGQVLAMVGSAGSNVPGSQYNMADSTPRNPGSSFKVFTYTAAIDSKKYTMVTPIQDVPMTLTDYPTYVIANYDKRYHGTCQIQACLGNSLNIPAVQVEMGTGVANVAGMAQKMGAPPYDANGKTNVAASTFTPSLTLGGYGETPLQMAQGVATLASGGVKRDAEGIVSARSQAGQSVYRSTAAGQQVVDAGTAYIMSQMLSDSANRAIVFGTNTPLTLSGHRAAAKTGTTDDYRDAWTVGYTPSLATAVWMGNTNNAQMTTGSDGIYVAAPAWHEFMQSALDAMNKGTEWYSQPGDVSTQYVNGKASYFLDGTSASTPAPALPSDVRLNGRNPNYCSGNGQYALCANGAIGQSNGNGQGNGGQNGG